MSVTHCDAEKAVEDGSYKAASDETLREMHSACLNVSGVNQSAITRIRKVGDIVREELSLRKKSQREQQSSVQISTQADDVSATVLQSPPGSSHSAWDEAKLSKMIQDGIEESHAIEYKAAAALARDDRKKCDITKDVSALANSAGGTLFYGMAEYQDSARKHLPERIDPVNRRSFSKEWLEHIISQIQPRIRDLRIHSVQLASAADHVAYVVEVPQGTTAHQATDYRYYRRFNFESVPMLDHEVRDVMNRKTHPRVTVSAQFLLYPRQNREGEAGALIVTITNNSDVFARYVALVMNAPIRVRGNLIMYNEAIIEEGSDGSSYRLAFSSHDSAPLFPHGMLRRVFQFKFAARLQPEPQKQLDRFRWMVFADSMPKQTGSFTIDEIFSKQIEKGALHNKDEAGP